jgi:hypothetical protein
MEEGVMQINQNFNQLSDTVQHADPRILDLRVWMIRAGMTFQKLGRALGGITPGGVHHLLKAERIPVARHKQLLDLGVPAHLLPRAQDVPKGRPRQ